MRPGNGDSESKDDAAPPPPGFDAASSSSSSSSSPLPFPPDPEALREELRVLRQREREILALLGSSSSQRILHDIRNLLNEVQLLRYLAEKND